MRVRKFIDRCAKKTAVAVAALTVAASASAQGWPAAYGGVMLQAFYWDSYVDTQWNYLEKQADEISQYFSLVWVPNSGYCGSGNNMGYMPQYYFNQNSSFGSEAELLSMINTYKSKGTGFIADVVINHRNNLGAGGSWTDFAAETYNGVKYQMLPSDICSDDDNGQTAAWASGNGISLSSNKDTGEGWSGCRDIDHKSANVNKVVKAYLGYLQNTLGYAGFRYDMVKGYSASFTGDYNSTVNATYSVGEYWDGNTAVVKNWIDGTKVNGTVQSAAFDFPFRYTCRDAVASSGYNWSKLTVTSLISDQNYRRYSVTFVENHDTQVRSANDQQDPIRRDTLALNAWMLAMPGTPCVFLKHWIDCKQEIKAMIDARKAVGINNQSTYSEYISQAAKCIRTVTGENGQLRVIVGDKSNTNIPNTMVQVLDGYHYRYLMSKSTEIAWADKASGDYEEAFKVKLVAVSAHDDAQLVYTTDGTEPSATNGTKVASGTDIEISSNCTLKVALVVGGTVKNVATRKYTVTPFVAHKATVYFKNPDWTSVYFYAWDSSNTLLGSWPGTKMTDKVVIDGVEWYYKSFDVNKKGYTFNIIFNKGMGQQQTVDIGPISQDVYYELSGTNDDKLTVKEVTPSGATSVAQTVVNDGFEIASANGRLQIKSNTSRVVPVYTAQGVLVKKLKVERGLNDFGDMQPGLYIISNQKVVVSY